MNCKNCERFRHGFCSFVGSMIPVDFIEKNNCKEHVARLDPYLILDGLKHKDPVYNFFLSFLSKNQGGYYPSSEVNRLREIMPEGKEKNSILQEIYLHL